MPAVRSRCLSLAACVAALGLVVPATASAADARPNIVFVLTDDQTMASLRTPGAMPFLRSLLSEPGWTRFTHAFDNTPQCCPARASILSGRYSHHTGVVNNSTAANFDEKDTIATWLHASGYTTSLVGKYLNQYPVHRVIYTPPGWDDWHALWMGGGGDHYYDYSLVEDGKKVSFTPDQGLHSTRVFGDRALRFLHTAPEPFFLYFAPFSPHKPAIPWPEHDGAFGTVPIAASPNQRERDVSDKPRWIQRKDLVPRRRELALARREEDSLLDVDAVLSDLVDALRQRGVWDRTVLVFTSDNGYSYGSHRLLGKKCVYDECEQVPLFIRVPGGPSHGVTRLVSNVDLAPTLAALGGASSTIPEDGRSLVPLLLRQRITWRNQVLMEWVGDRFTPGFWAIRTRRYKFVRLATGEREFYDLKLDPQEMTNQARNPPYRSVRKRLACWLDVLRGAARTC
jgi:N-acetylglucosamine-6-sulfatase